MEKYKINTQSAIEYCGGVPELIKALGVGYETIRQWDKSGYLSTSASYRLAAIAPHKFSPPDRIIKE